MRGILGRWVRPVAARPLVTSRFSPPRVAITSVLRRPSCGQRVAASIGLSGSARRSLTVVAPTETPMVRKNSCRRESPGQFGVERGGEQVALAGGDDRAVFERRDGPCAAGDRVDERRANEDGVERRHLRCPRSSRSASKLSTWRPKALRRTEMSITSMPGRSRLSTVFARRMAPAQVPQTGLPLAQKSRSGCWKPLLRMSRAMVVLSPPGMMSASISATAALADLRDRVAQPLEHLAVLAEVALEGEDADGHGSRAVQRNRHCI